MNGMAIIRGLRVTLHHFLDTYIQDIKGGKARYFTKEGVAGRQKSGTSGIFTVQYPEEKLPVPEEFRYIPFLVYDVTPEGEKKIRCTACGICTKVCPPQCIWIVRKANPETGKPVAAPAEYHIDIDVCMNCGFCAEYCPFDAIKMDHDYEIASVDRMKHHLFDLDRLLRPAAYYQQIRPLNYARETAEKNAKKGTSETAP